MKNTDYIVLDEHTTYILHDGRWLASSPVHQHPNLFQVQCITHSTDVHYMDFVTTGGADSALFDVIQSGGYKTLRVSFTPWNAPLNPFELWREHPARKELLKWNLYCNETDPDWLALLALPGSFSEVRITMLQVRYPDLLIELV